MTKARIAKMKIDAARAASTHRLCEVGGIVLASASAFMTLTFFAAITQPVLVTGAVVGLLITMSKVLGTRTLATLGSHRDREIENRIYEYDPPAQRRELGYRRWKRAMRIWAGLVLASVGVSAMTGVYYIRNVQTNATSPREVIAAKRENAQHRIASLENEINVFSTLMISDEADDIRRAQVMMGAKVDGRKGVETQAQFKLALASKQAELAEVRATRDGLAVEERGFIAVGYGDAKAVLVCAIVISLVLEALEFWLNYNSLSFRNEHKLHRKLRTVTRQDCEVHDPNEIYLPSVVDATEVFNNPIRRAE